MKEVTRSSIIKDILLTCLTLGIWNLYVQIRQIADINQLLGVREIPSFAKVFLFSVLTLGIYFCYHEYKLTNKLHSLNYNKTYPGNEYFMGFLTFLGLWFIVDSYQQSLINAYLEVGWSSRQAQSKQ
jgi:hypothetical protein